MHPDSVVDWLAKFSKRHGLPHASSKSAEKHHFGFRNAQLVKEREKESQQNPNRPPDGRPVGVLLLSIWRQRFLFHVAAYILL